MRLALLALTGMLATQTPHGSPEEAMRFHQKLLGILQPSGARAPGARRTTFTEGETNAYLQYGVGTTLPAGVTEPSVTLVGQGRLGGRAVVDLDGIRQAKSSGGWLDPLAYLTGKLPVTAQGVLTAKAGQARFTLESAAVNGVPIPKTVLQQIVSYYTRTPDQPEGVNLDAPFALPADIQRIDIEPGQAIVMQ
jgi:hypothetical protein